jgi:hypothetical protein
MNEKNDTHVIEGCVETLSRKKIRNFKLVVHETWRRTSYPVIFKMYKKKIWSENYETCRDVMISYGEAVIKI